MIQEFYRSFSGLTVPAVLSHAQRLSSLQSFEKALPLRMVTQSLLLRLVTSTTISNSSKLKGAPSVHSHVLPLLLRESPALLVCLSSAW